MPELPEIEHLRRGLDELLQPRPVLTRFEFFRRDIRDIIPVRKLKSLEGQRLTEILRRSKYLFFAAEQGGVLSHLGMTGSWRLEDPRFERNTHDHVAIHLSTKQVLIYRDPRRFGVVDWAESLSAAHPRLDALGVEPLSALFSPEYLSGYLQKRQAPIKNILMNAQVVVGIGNIYASEILFRSAVRPGRPGSRVKPFELGKIVEYSKIVLREAIAAGGSSISDYVNASGGKGDFQNRFKVYDRDGEKCLTCETLIRREVLGGRSSFFCPSCQR